MSGPAPPYATGAAVTASGSPSKWTVLGIASLASLVTTLDMSSVSVVLPRLATAFNVDTSTVLWVGIAYLLTSAGLLFTMGWMGDRIGRRPTLAVGFATFTAGLALVSSAPNVFVLLVGRVVQATGTSMLLGNGNAVLADAFPAREWARAIGLRGAVVGLGLGAGPVLTGFLLEVLDWRAVFYIPIPLSLAGVFLSWVMLRDRMQPQRGQARPDIVGAATLFGSVAGFLLAVNQAGRVGLGSPLVWYGAVAALVLFPAFLVLERRSSDPVLDLSLFRRPRFSLALACLALHFLAWGAVQYMGPFYLMDGLRLTPFTAGLILTSFPGMRVLVSPLSGYIAERVGTGGTSTAGLLTVAVGLFLLSRLGTSPAPWVVAGTLMLTGVGSALFEPVNTAQVLASAPSHRMGTASASVPAGRQSSVSAGAALMGAVFVVRHASHAEAVPEEAAVALGFGDAMVVASLLALMGAVVSALGLRRAGTEKGNPG